MPSEVQQVGCMIGWKQGRWRLLILLLILLFLLEDALWLRLGIGIRELGERVGLVSMPQNGGPHIIVALHVQLALRCA